MKHPPDPLVFSSPSPSHLPASPPINFLPFCHGLSLFIPFPFPAYIFGVTVRPIGDCISRSGCWFRISISSRRIYGGLCMNFLLVLGDEAQLTAFSFLYLSWDFYVLFIRIFCPVSNLWPYLCRFDWIWSSNGGFPLDLHLMLKSVRSCCLPSSFSSSLRSGM